MGAGGWLVEAGLVLSGCHVGECRVPPLPVVVHLDVVEQCQAGVFPRGIGLVMNQFGLEGPEKTLDDGVVVSVARATHAGNQAVFGQQALVIIARVLHAAVAVV